MFDDPFGPNVRVNVRGDELVALYRARAADALTIVAALEEQTKKLQSSAAALKGTLDERATAAGIEEVRARMHMPPPMPAGLHGHHHHHGPMTMLGEGQLDFSLAEIERLKEATNAHKREHSYLVFMAEHVDTAKFYELGPSALRGLHGIGHAHHFGVGGAIA
jgi:hypothetical protein